MLGGVAAKAAGAHHTRPLVRKSVRTRHRNTVPKPLKIPDKVPEEGDSKSAPPLTHRRIDFTISTSPMQLPFIPTQEPLRPLAMDLDTDTETEVCMTPDDADRDEIKTVETPPSLTDFSSFLDVSIIDEEYDTSSVTVFGSETSRTENMEDLYGWEAELNRKVKCGLTNSNICHCDEFEYRNTVNGNKRGLLHRVFSSGRRPS